MFIFFDCLICKLLFYSFVDFTEEFSNIEYN
jgi:hypothetical protein